MASRRPPLMDAPPVSDQITDYDCTHFPTYMFLLDWSAAGATWRDAMVQLLGAEVTSNPDRAKNVYDAHLARAKWVTHTGWSLLLRADGWTGSPLQRGEGTNQK